MLLPQFTRAARRALAAAVIGAIPLAASAAFGVTDDGSFLVVDSGAGLVFKVSKTNGDIRSIKINDGVELLGQTKGTHISSGINAVPSASVTGSTILLTLPTSTLTHYLAVRQNENVIYMATYITAEPTVGELRWITRLSSSVFTVVPPESNLAGNTGAIESSDVFGMADGSTRSKYYGNQRAKDLTLRGVSGGGYGVFMAYGSRESSSGGPFFRDIQFQSSGDVELYNYMNSGHAQTEAFRMGLHGPYALVFTTTGRPAVPDMRWMSALGLQGWVPAAQRGSVTLSALAGMDARYSYTVGLANSAAQYWGTASSAGAVSIPGVKPGTYKLTVYKGELSVLSETVSVGEGQTVALGARSIVADPSMQAVLWRLGDWDGTPLEFLNGSTIPVRHPQDARNAAWSSPVTVSAGSAASGFPAVLWKGKNSGSAITFTLTADQIAARTVRIGITSAYSGGRPQIKVNNWTSSVPAISTQANSRHITIGTWRGNNTIFSYSVPASAFVVGTNTLTVTVASGSTTVNWLAPDFSLDAIDLY